MLRKINKANNKKSISDSLSTFKKLPKSKKVYFQSKKFKDVKVGMREITLEDKDILNLPEAPDFISQEPEMSHAEMIALCEQMLPFWNKIRFSSEEHQKLMDEPFEL